ncbi:MAG: peptidylprolyl isomerase [Litorimonas sp.]
MKYFALTAAALTLLTACADKRPNVVLQTDMGPIEIEVYKDKAPASATDFLYYVDNALYDNQGFYRVVRADNDPLEMGMSLVQGGRLDTLPLTSGIAHERTTQTGLSNVTGTVSIARDEPGSGSAAYFFINTGDNSFLDTGGTRNPDGEGYATFAKVISGMDVVIAIQKQEAKGTSDSGVTQGQILTKPVRIMRAYRK